MKNEQQLLPFFRELQQKKDNEEFVIDKSGVKTVELIAPRLLLDPTQPMLEFNGRKTPKKYVQAETEWYDSMDLSVEEIGKSASIWNDICDENGFINSNYGYLCFHPGNHCQFQNATKELKSNPDSRRSIIIYTRPSIQYEYNSGGKSDFICTLSHQFMIRNNKLQSVVQMRSNDAVFGLFNDLA